MGCDIHTRAEVRTDGEWHLVGVAFEDPRPFAVGEDSSEWLATLSDGQLVEAFSWLGATDEEYTEPYRARLSEQAVSVLGAMRRHIQEGGGKGGPAEAFAAKQRRAGVVLHPDIRAELVRLGDLDDPPWTNLLYRAEGEPVFKTSKPYQGRNYALFAMLADVRNEPGWITPIDEPRGVPADVSEAGQRHMESYGVDGHSHTWFTLRELLEVPWDENRVTEYALVDIDFAGEQRLDQTWREAAMFDHCLENLRSVIPEGGSEDDVRLIAFFDN